MNLEEIMKPYFEKKEELDKKLKDSSQLNEMYLNCLHEKNKIEQKLQKLKDNKEKEIVDYIQNQILNKKNYYPGYIEMIRNDLEKSYLDREQELIKELEKIDKLLEKLNDDLNNIYKYYMVDVREIAEIKNSLRKSLFSLKYQFELRLKELCLSHDVTNEKLTIFKYEYNSKGEILNVDDYNKLLESSNNFVESKYNLQMQLKKVNEFIDITVLTKEEVNSLIRTMNPLEKQEYDRRKLASGLEIEQDNLVFTSLESELEQKSSLTKDIDAEEESENMASPFLENEATIDNARQLLDLVYEEILKVIKKMRSVRIDAKDMRRLITNSSEEKINDSDVDIELGDKVLKLPSGEYLYEGDLLIALNNYVKQNKCRTIKLKSIDKTCEIGKDNIKLVIEALKNYGMKKLIKEKKLSSFDIKRVYGKEYADRYAELGRVKTKMPAGNYINENDFCNQLEKLFVEKQSSWLDKFSKNINIIEDIIKSKK